MSGRSGCSGAEQAALEGRGAELRRGPSRTLLGGLGLGDRGNGENAFAQTL